jgi:hypothetical protein
MIVGPGGSATMVGSFSESKKSSIGAVSKPIKALV